MITRTHICIKMHAKHANLKNTVTTAVIAFEGSLRDLDGFARGRVQAASLSRPE